MKECAAYIYSSAFSKKSFCCLKFSMSLFSSRYVVKELIHTELDYVKDLESVVEVNILFYHVIAWKWPAFISVAS
jgi:hypothetical protein